MENEELRNIAQELANRYKMNIKESGHVASGNILNFTCDIEYNDKGYQIIFNLPPYWEVLENGATYRGKMPPVDAIEKWISVKPIVPHNSNKIKDTRQLAFAMAKTIKRNGIRGNHLLRKTIEESDDILGKIPLAIRDILLDEIREIKLQ